MKCEDELQVVSNNQLKLLINARVSGLYGDGINCDALDTIIKRHVEAGMAMGCKRKAKLGKPFDTHKQTTSIFGVNGI